MPTCPSGYSDPANYPKQTPKPPKPWDSPDSPQYLAYVSCVNGAWATFEAARNACPQTEDGCVQTSCIVARYATYISAINNCYSTYEASV